MVKKQLIMEKALELFAKQGFEATSIQQITEHCGISKGAFYLSFKSKDELILSLVDQFMQQIIAEIDHSVKTAKNEDLLYTFFYKNYQSFSERSDFAKLIMNEQTLVFNDELFLKIKYYDSLSDKIILTLLERLYGEKVKDTKYDLIYCIKAFMQMYSGLFLFHNIPLDIDLLARSLVEKTEIIALHSTIPFVTKGFCTVGKQPLITKEHVLETVDEMMKESGDPIVKESLMLLREQLQERTYSSAIIKGLLENIRSHPHYRWISYSISNYFKLDTNNH